jgi:hypothetical protein
MQPAYIPWLGFFERIALSDILVVLDHVQLDTNSKTNFVNRNRIKTPQGSTLLTVPLSRKGRHRELFINKMEIDNTSNWKYKHINTLKQFYGKSPFYKIYFLKIEELIQDSENKFSVYVQKINDYLLEVIKIEPQVILSSSIVNLENYEGENLILEICKKLNAKKYISGPFGRDYLNKDNFDNNLISLYFHDYHHPTYKQNFEGFIPHLSILDLLFNHGDESLNILQTTKSVYDLSK